MGSHRSGCFEEHFDATQMQVLPVLEQRLVHGRAIYIRAVGRAEVLEQHARAADDDLTVQAGNRGMIDLKVILVRAPEAILARLELDFPSLRCAGVDQKAVRHGSKYSPHY